MHVLDWTCKGVVLVELRGIAKARASGVVVRLAVGLVVAQRRVRATDEHRDIAGWAKRAGVRMPIAHADTRFLARIGGVRVTPLTVLVDHSGDIRQRFVGSIDGTVLEAEANSEVP
jgi:hypothetical protein